MSKIGNWIIEQMEAGCNVLESNDVDYEMDYYDWSQYENDESSTSHYELHTNGEVIVEADTLSDAFYVKEFIEQHEGYSNIQISRVEFPY